MTDISPVAIEAGAKVLFRAHMDHDMAWSLADRDGAIWFADAEAVLRTGTEEVECLYCRGTSPRGCCPQRGCVNGKLQVLRT